MAFEGLTVLSQKPTNWILAIGGALYRACISLAAAKDHKTLLATMQRECQGDPEMISNFTEDEHLAHLFSLPEFRRLRDRYVE